MYFKIIFYLSLIIWLFPVFRQYKSELFKLFVVLAVSDPLALILTLLSFQSYTFLLSELLVLIMIFILMKRSLISFKLLSFGIIIVLINLIIHNELVDSSLLIGELVFLFIIVLKLFAEQSIAKKSLNLFYVILLFYYLTVILKILIVIIGTPHANEYFIITTIFQILFGLFFSIFREDDPRLLVKLE